MQCLRVPTTIQFMGSDRLTLLLQLDIPIRDIEKILPHFSMLMPKDERDDRPPLGSHRFTDEPHPGLMRQTVRLV